MLGTLQEAVQNGGKVRKPASSMWFHNESVLCLKNNLIKEVSVDKVAWMAAVYNKHRLNVSNNDKLVRLLLINTSIGNLTIQYLNKLPYTTNQQHQRKPIISPESTSSNKSLRMITSLISYAITIPTNNSIHLSDSSINKRSLYQFLIGRVTIV